MAGGSENNMIQLWNGQEARGREFNAQKQALRDMVSEIHRTRQQHYRAEHERSIRRNSERMRAMMHIQLSVKNPMEGMVEMSRFYQHCMRIQVAELERSRALNLQMQALTNMERELRSRIHNSQVQEMVELNKEIQKKLKEFWEQSRQQGLNGSSHSNHPASSNYPAEAEWIE